MSGLLYLYGLIPTEEASKESLPAMRGFDGEGKLYTIEIGEVTAIVCDLSSQEYSEDSLRNKVEKDMDWLQEKAFHHHETVLMVSKLYTIIPLKFCTLYKNEENLKSTIEGNRNKLEATFKQLDGNEEWNVKIYCDDKVLKKQVSENHPSIEAKRKEISKLPKGRQFFEMKKIDQLVDRELENEKNRLCEEVHEKLKEHSLQGNIKKNWSKGATGRQEHMAWNSVFLLPDSKVEEFVEEIKHYEEEMGHAGWKIEASGPWPPYHFSSFSS
ncbi:GvpL/GvpF family gas vesicle protein [Rossellomorea sp. AcN35-11]|nr:GvpL/GvpF family gas vesicle protein [Rossellomorea aquimaris]WJV30600.1 GvpL/GvpF family gas vesicle protein [Rossellomorea sp. AcN35-11]